MHQAFAYHCNAGVGDNLFLYHIYTVNLYACQITIKRIQKGAQQCKKKQKICKSSRLISKTKVNGKSYIELEDELNSLGPTLIYHIIIACVVS